MIESAGYEDQGKNRANKNKVYEDELFFCLKYSENMMKNRL